MEFFAQCIRWEMFESSLIYVVEEIQNWQTARDYFHRLLVTGTSAFNSCN